MNEYICQHCGAEMRPTRYGYRCDNPDCPWVQVWAQVRRWLFGGRT